MKENMSAEEEMNSPLLEYGQKPRRKQSQAMALVTSMNSVDWFTPRWLTDAARKVMGGIDLDPASHPLPQTWIKAADWYSLKHPDDAKRDGLAVKWAADSVWLNPPYNKTDGKSNQEIWTNKLAHHYAVNDVEQGLALVNSKVGYAWFERLAWEYPHCQLRDRVRFVNEQGEVGGQAKVGQTVFYFGRDVDGFDNEFHHYGRVSRPQGRKWVRQRYYHLEPTPVYSMQ